MESIFESLENLNVSENCFQEIIERIVEALDSHGDNPEISRLKQVVADALTKYGQKFGNKGSDKDPEVLSAKKAAERAQKDLEKVRDKVYSPKITFTSGSFGIKG